MLTRSPRGALVYVREDKQSKREKMARLAVIILAMASLLLLGLPGDPMHGASKYEPEPCAGVLECFNNN